MTSSTCRVIPEPNWCRIRWAALLLVSKTLFLWMFFSVAPLERMADKGLLFACGADARVTAYEFAARWRHGMASNSPLFMPGFFAVALACWFWSRRKSFRLIILEGALVLALAFLFAS